MIALRERAGRLVTQATVMGMQTAVRMVEAFISHTPDGRRPFFDPKEFPWVAGLERAWPVIRQELDRLMPRIQMMPNFQDLQPLQRSLTLDSRWKIFPLVGYGIKWQANCDRCPETARLLEQIPGLTTAMFSILRPGKHLPAHRGPYKGVLRYHLGLKIPEQVDGKCRIRVGDEVRGWREGRSLIFDDTFDHEAWNDTGETRVVLFADVLRPLPFPLATVNRGVIQLIAHSPFIQRGLKNLAQWEEVYGQEFDADK